MNNVIVQTQLEKVWVSTVDISVTRTWDSLIAVVSPILEPEGSNRPGMRTNALEFQYETMVFPSDGKGPTDREELDCERYHSREDAITGHMRMVEKWKKEITCVVCQDEGCEFCPRVDREEIS